VNPTTLTPAFGRLLIAPGTTRLLYQFAMAMIVSFGPLFILCLIFDQTKDLFRRWLLYGIGTLFSIATLCLVTSIMLKLVENVAIALWSADLINNFIGAGTEGFSSRALEQGGIGLLLTVVIISVPPLTAMFFQGTVGNFMPYAAIGGGGPGPQGQPPGAYGGGGSYAAPASNTAQTADLGKQVGATGYNTSPATTALTSGKTATAHNDIVRPYNPSP
jgi:type IV secretion system protein VirB6